MYIHMYIVIHTLFTIYIYIYMYIVNNVGDRAYIRGVAGTQGGPLV